MGTRLLCRLLVLSGVAVALGASFGPTALSAAPAAATPVGVIVDSSPVQLAPGTGDEHVVKVYLINTTTSAVTVTPGIDGDAGCVVTPQPGTIEPGLRTPVTLTLGAGCETAKGADITLAFAPDVTPASITIKATPPPASGPDWTILAWGLGIAGFAVVCVVLWNLIRIGEINVPRKKVERIGWATPLNHLGTSWSFKDSWVANVSLGASALIALLASSDILTAVLGDKPAAALGVMAVAAGIAAVCVTIGPLILKAIGSEVDVPTAGGTIVAAVVVLFGSLTQVSTITIQATKLTHTGWLQALVWVVGALVVLIVGFYGARALTGLMIKGTTAPKHDPPPEVQAAVIIAKAIRSEPSKKAQALRTLGLLRAGAPPGAPGAPPAAAADPFDAELDALVKASIGSGVPVSRSALL